MSTPHKCSTIMPIVMQCLNPRGKVSAIYAYAPAPFTREKVRVQVVWAGSLGTPPRRYADVRPVGASENIPAYRVFVDQLTSITVFTTWEMEE